MLETFQSKLSALPDPMITQGAVLYLQKEYGVLGVDMNRLQTNYILTAGAFMLLIALASMASTVIVAYLGAKVAAGLARSLRAKVFRKVTDFSNPEFDRFSTASLITRSTNDIQQIQMLMVMLLRIVFYAPILGIGGAFKVLAGDSSMGWTIAVAVMAILTLVTVLFGIAIPKFKMVQKLVDRLNLVTREILTGTLVIRAFNTQKHEEKKFDFANMDLTKTNLYVTRVMAIMMPAMMLIMNATTLLIVWVGAHQIDQGVMQVGDMMAFIQYAMQIIMAFLMISMVSVMLPRATVSAQRIGEVLDTDISVRDASDAEPIRTGKKGYIAFKHVSFRYPGAEEDVLSDISFTAAPGQTVALIGSTGSGKTTLVNLIERFYDVTGGEILIDGVDVRKISQHELREKIGYVPQRAVLFSGSIESNLRYGAADATGEEMEKAARIAQAMEFIEEMPEGFETNIAQGGANVSGGQKQRLSIARALVKKPEIYLFDDSFSALDYKTDAALRKALKETTAESTVLIVGQRISTIKNADQIIVLEEGKIAGIGTHNELMRSNEVYQQIALSQLSKEELEK
jgi:ATP-binding cassette subfamily B protein